MLLLCFGWSTGSKYDELGMCSARLMSTARHLDRGEDFVRLYLNYFYILLFSLYKVKEE